MKQSTKLRFLLIFILFISYPLTMGSTVVRSEYVSLDELHVVNLPAKEEVLIVKRGLAVADLEALDIIKASEGFRSNRYLCPSGTPTIGYGFTRRSETYMTREQSDSLLLNIYKSTKEKVVSHIKNDNLTDYQIASLTSFAYNVGIGAFKKSTLLKRINNNELDKVATEFSRWNKARVNGKKVTLRGLVKRRKLETNLWLKSVEPFEGDWTL